MVLLTLRPSGALPPRVWRVVGAEQLDHLAVRVLDHIHALDEVAVAQPHLAPNGQAEVLGRRRLAEVVLLDPQLAAEGHLAHAGRRVLGVVDRVQPLDLALRVVDQRHLERVEHAHHPQRVLVQVLADRVFQQGQVHHAVVLGHADALGEVAQRGRGHAAAAQPAQGRHARVVPAADDALVDQLEQPALAHHGVGQVETGELDLLRRVDAQFLDEPVVQRPVVLELQRADGVGDALDAVRLAVGPVVHRVDAPGVARARVLGVQDAVHHRVAQVEVGRGHVDLGAQGAAAVGELAGLHALEQVEVLLDGAVAVGAGAARARSACRGTRAPRRRSGRRRRPCPCGSAARPSRRAAGSSRRRRTAGPPVRAQPAHVLDDGVDVFLLFLGRVGVVEAQVELAAVLLARP
jgi:hypothetical protein